MAFLPAARREERASGQELREKIRGPQIYMCFDHPPPHHHDDKHEERSDALRRAFSGDVAKGGFLVATHGSSAAEEALGVAKYHPGHRFLGAS